MTDRAAPQPPSWEPAMLTLINSISENATVHETRETLEGWMANPDCLWALRVLIAFAGEDPNGGSPDD